MAIRPLIALLGAAAVLLAGCTGSGSGSTAVTDSANPGAPTKGGTLTVAIDSDPGQLNPAITTSGGTHTASELIYNGLVDLTPDLKPVPDLAESWDVLDNGALYRFHLRQGVKWHDGAPFTSAADVKFTFEQMLLKFHSRTKASVGAPLQSIATPDTDTVEFRFAKPYAPLLLQLNVTEAPILPKHLYEGTDVQKNPANSKPIGTGPISSFPISRVRSCGLPRTVTTTRRICPTLTRWSCGSSRTRAARSLRSRQERSTGCSVRPAPTYRA